MERTNTSLAVIFLSSLMLCSTSYAKDFIDQTMDDVVTGVKVGGSLSLTYSGLVYITSALSQVAPTAWTEKAMGDAVIPATALAIASYGDEVVDLKEIKNATLSSKAVQLLAAAVTFCAGQCLQAKLAEVISPTPVIVPIAVPVAIVS